MLGEKTEGQRQVDLFMGTDWEPKLLNNKEFAEFSQWLADNAIRPNIDGYLEIYTERKIPWSSDLMKAPDGI